MCFRQERSKDSAVMRPTLISHRSGATVHWTAFFLITGSCVNLRSFARLSFVM
jgi:hypothetical protein